MVRLEARGKKNLFLKLPRLVGPPNINQWSEMGGNFIFEVGLGASWPSFIFTNFGGQRPKLEASNLTIWVD